MHYRRRTQREPLVFFSGAWFAMALSLPALLLWSTTDQSDFLFLLLVVLPGVTAFVCGEGLGSDILSPKAVGDWKGAVRRGIEVAFLSSLFFTPAGALALTVFEAVYARDPHEWLTVQFCENLFANLFYVGAAALVFFFAVEAAAGALAGWLLLKFRLYREGN